MKTLAAVAITIALAVFWYLHRSSSSHASTAAPPTTAPSATSTAQPTAPVQRPPAHVTKLSPEERKAVADRIASAQASRAAATRAPVAPKLPDRPTLDPNDLEGFKTTIRSAMKEVIPMLADCYDKAGSSVPTQLTVRAHLKLTGDPDIGTLIDADKATDNHEAPLPAGFDDCLRSTLQSLELPPLSEGDEVTVTYPFVFRASE